MNKVVDFSGIFARFLPSFGEILFIALFFAIIGFGPQLMNIDGDLGRHITLGNYIIDSQAIPTKDVFSFTKLGDPLTPHEWLTDVLFAISHRFAGLDGVVWLTALILGTAYWLIYKHCLNLSNMPLLALFGALLAAAASSLHWLTRPHIFTILLTGIWVAELEKLRLGIRKNWAIFPLLMFVWVNLHGAFMVGIVIWAAYIAGIILEKGDSSKYQSFLWGGLISILVTLINPDGLGLWRTGVGFIGNKYLVSHTAEYLPPDFHLSSTWPFLVMIILSLVILAIGKRKYPVSHILLIAGFTAMGLISTRNIPLYAVVVVPILAAGSSFILYEHQDRRLIKRLLSFQERLLVIESSLKGGFWSLIALILAGILLMSGVKLDTQQQGNQFLAGNFPVEVVDLIEKDLPEGNGFNYFPWGGYLLYRLWPEKLVFIDGQTDFYGEDLTREYEQVITLADGWEEIFRKYQIEWVLMPSQSDLILYLNMQDDWQIQSETETATLLINPYSE